MYRYRLEKGLPHQYQTVTKFERTVCSVVLPLNRAGPFWCGFGHNKTATETEAKITNSSSDGFCQTPQAIIGGSSGFI